MSWNSYDHSLIVPNCSHEDINGTHLDVGQWKKPVWNLHISQDARKRADFYRSWGVYWRNAGPSISHSVQLVCVPTQLQFDAAHSDPVSQHEAAVSHNNTLTQTATQVLTGPSALHQQISAKSASCSVHQEFQNQFISSSLSIQMPRGHKSMLLCHLWPQIWN